MVDDTGTDWAALADKLSLRADYVDSPSRCWPAPHESADDLREAAVGLRRLAQLDTAHRELLDVIDRKRLRQLADNLEAENGTRKRWYLTRNARYLRRIAQTAWDVSWATDTAVLGSGEQPEGPTT